MVDISRPESQEWIAIESPFHAQDPPRNSENLPSFGQSQYDIVLRRQRLRPKGGGGLKFANVPSRFLNLSNDFEFAGWGVVSRLELSPEDHKHGEEALKHLQREQTLGQFTASALAGNDLLGGIFYTLPPVFAASSIYSPISLFISTLTLFIWRPIMEELASALPLSGASYIYLLNSSKKSLAMVGAVLILLDLASTAIVSAATAASYLAGEVHLPFPAFVGAILVLVIFTCVSLSGVRESARIAFVVLAFHLGTMFALFVASIVAWARLGNIQLRENWYAGQAHTSSSIIRQVFNGVCIGMLGLTGFECTPDYISKMKPGRFPSVLRNLHFPAIILNTLMPLLVMALLPLPTILGGINVLSVLAEVVAGRWLRTWIVVDAVTVLCGGVLTGILSACELLLRLSRDRVIPQIFLRTIPLTGSPFVCVISFVGFSGVIYASTGANLTIISEMFSLVWLTVMTLFPLSLLLLKSNRGRFPRVHRAPLSLIFFALALCPVIFAGNIALDPKTSGFFAAYFFGVLFFFMGAQNKTHLLRWLYWAYDQSPALHTWRPTCRWGTKLITSMTRLRRQPVCILAKTDEINHLFKMVLYVSQNEETSYLKIVHFCVSDKPPPSELEANAKILDEAFPEITIDLIIVQGTFTPPNVAALAHHLGIQPSLMFMSCPGPNFPHSMAELGTRVIVL